MTATASSTTGTATRTATRGGRGDPGPRTTDRGCTAPGAGDPGPQIAAPDRSRAAQGRGGAQGPGGEDRVPRGHPGRRREGVRDHQGGAPGGQGGLRRRAADPDRP